MRIVSRESIAEAKVMLLAGSERPVEIEAVIDVNGRVKVSRIIEGEPLLALGKPQGRYALLPLGAGSTSKQHIS